MALGVRIVTFKMALTFFSQLATIFFRNALFFIEICHLKKKKRTMMLLHIFYSALFVHISFICKDGQGNKILKN